MIRILLCLLACTALGCDAPAYRPDAGASADASGPRGRLEIESASPLMLVFGEVAPIDVRYTENGEPVAGVVVRFALEGRAHDASVSALWVTTDAEGRAQTYLTASSTATVFRTRVSAERAGPVYVDVSVDNMGFGDLRVVPVYEGVREGVRVVEVYSHLRCEDERPVFADRTRIIEASQDAVRFGALSAGIVYAVVGRLSGPSGATLAEACVDGVEIEPHEETRVDLELLDAPLLPRGRYALELALETGAAAGVVADLGVAAGAAELAADSTAGVYLDALEAELAYRGELTTLDLLRAERATGVPVAELTARLEDASVDLGVALEMFGDALASRLALIGVAGPLALTAEEGALHAHLDVTALTIGARDVPDMPAIPVAPDAIGWELAPALTFGAPEGDRVGLSSLSMSLPLGRLASQTVEWIATGRGLATPGALLEPQAGCDVLASWVAEQAVLAACDADCAHAACVRGLDGVMQSVQSGLSSADARESVELSGSVALEDDDADTVVDRMSATLEGAWVGAGDPVSAELTAVRAAE